MLVLPVMSRDTSELREGLQEVINMGSDTTAEQLCTTIDGDLTVSSLALRVGMLLEAFHSATHTLPISQVLPGAWHYFFRV